MKKILFTVVVAFLVSSGYSQLNNSWIDYNKTYYKFSLGKDTLCRIPKSMLTTLGLDNVPAENFQLWRNGEQVRLYTSVPTGQLGASDYIEFWGHMNDGKPDKILYRDQDFQENDKFSLQTDTVAYFLTVNPAGGNLRYTQQANPVSTNTLPADAYFMRRIEKNYQSQINRGYAAVLVEYVFSSAYDMGEGWTSGDVFPGYDLSEDISGLNLYAAGPPNSVMFTLAASGNALNGRQVYAKFYGDTVLMADMPFFNYIKDTVRNLPLSLLQSPTNLPVYINGNSSEPTDRIVVACFSVTYPATFNFNNSRTFYFELAPSAAGNYLVINNFNTGGAAPILYDITNGNRYLGDISVAGQVRFALPGSTQAVRKFNLIAQDAAGVKMITSGFTTKNFLNLATTANQGNYLIISHPTLYNDGSGHNNVDLYRQYRSSITGGSFNAKVYDINELVDQFGFGIKMHPSAIRDFIRYADQSFAQKPQYVFLIGHGITYNDFRTYESAPTMNNLELVPTFGWPASDILLSAQPGQLIPITPIGRLGAVNGTEVGNYLQKMKEYEAAQASSSQSIADKGWMKNIIHIAGGADSTESASFEDHLNTYRDIAVDTLFGAHVETFTKSGTGTVQEASSVRINQLFTEGLSVISYFGHSSANTLAFNLSNPEVYTNTGKYPFINVSGCSAGDFFSFDPSRLSGNLSISEKYVMASEKGSIAFFADTHFGIEPFLNYYNTDLYYEFCRNTYGGTIGNQIKNVITTLGSQPLTIDYYTRMHLEELLLQGDPALKINAFTKPDYVVEDQLIRVSPTIVSVADNNFNLDVKWLNIGKAINDSIRVTIKRQLPNDSIKVLFNKMVAAPKYSDSASLVVPINPLTDKGLNKIIVTLDVDNRVVELNELNNTFTKEFYIFEDELKPVTPYNFSIVNTQNITYSASTANPLVQQRQYMMDVDTTELFNSPFKKSYNSTGNGGVIQFKPTNITFTDSTVYYWRTAMAPTGTNPIIWNTSSFIYLANGTPGFNQSHLYQQLKSTYSSIKLDSTTRAFTFDPKTTNIISNIGLFPYAIQQGSEFNLFINGAQYIQDACDTRKMIFTIFNPASVEPVLNAHTGDPGRYGSEPPCGTVVEYDFEFDYGSAANRKKIVDFMDSVPSGYYVVARNTMIDPAYNTAIYWPYAQDFATDPLENGFNLTTKFRAAGFTDIDSFNRAREFTVCYKKNDNAVYPARWSFTAGIADKNSFEFNIYGRQGEGTITTPLYGPAKRWDFLHWRGSSVENPTFDSTYIDVYGVNNNGTATMLKRINNARDTSLSFVDPLLYPYLQLQMYNSDFQDATPYQVRYLRVNGQYVPEGAVAPNILYQMKDTANQGELVDFKLAFKNIGPVAFDSMMKLKFTITDNNNVPHSIDLPKGKILAVDDTLAVKYQIDTRNYPGNNTLAVEVNPNNDQPEQVHFNNILYKDFYVKPDNFNPLLDVTFDGVHILNKDIVASKPHIFIKLKDESKYLALTDTSLMKVQVRYPDNTLHNYNFGDTMRFTPAIPGSPDNTASIDFLPNFPQDGEYELIVSGKDVLGNTAGQLDYHVIFTVINKPMISNLLNYPNPFTTSTAFVFTVTGSVVPQNIRIEILTITGKIVREITSNELGPIHIGRNITEFKWDGTDTYGQKLGNGVYLYRVLTNLNGKALDKYTADGDNTDKYFTKGYGKMVILR